MALEDFDDDFTTTTATRDDLSKLPDGEYEFAVKGMEVKDGDNTGSLVELKVEVISDGEFRGSTAKKTYWLTQKNQQTGLREKNERQIVELRKDLTALGFDPEDWTKQNSRPFSVEIRRAAAAIPGVCFKGKKKQGGAKPQGGGYYQNLYVNERLPDDGKPLKFTVKDLDEANADPFGD